MTTLLSNSLHTISALVANEPGVLARIAQVFSRRGFNIESLVVSQAGDGKFSRMTITASGNPAGLDQIIKQVNKLIDVLHCIDHTGEDSVVKEMALVKVAIEPEDRTAAMQVSEHFNARSVDLTKESMIFMITGSTEKLDAFIDMMKEDFKIIEMVRTGKVAMSRGALDT